MKYDTAIDRESAYEILTGREAAAAQDRTPLAQRQKPPKPKPQGPAEALKATAAARCQPRPSPRLRAKRRRSAPAARKSTRQTPVEAATSTFMRTATRELTKFVFRGIFGNRKR